MKLIGAYFLKFYWLIFALVVYFYLSLYVSPVIGLGSGEFNMNLASSSYPLAVISIDNNAGTLVDKYAAPVAGFFSEARINRIGPLETIQTVIEPEYSLRIFNTVFPVMKNKYTGALSYYYARFFNLFGNNKVFLIHFASIFLGATIIILTACLAYFFLGRKVAILCTFLLSTNPLFIIFKRLPAFPEHFTELFSIGILIVLLLYLKTQRVKYLYLCAFFIGLAIYQKATIFWTLSALFVLAIVFRPKTNLNPRRLIIGFIYFLLGILPLLLYNFLCLGTINLSASFFLKEAFLQEVSARISDWFYRFIFIFGDPVGFFRYLFYGIRTSTINYFLNAILLSSFLFPFFSLLKKEPWTKKIKVIFFPLLVVLMLFSMSIINRVGFDFPHTFLLVPFVVIIESVFLVYFLEILEELTAGNFKWLTKQAFFFILITLLVFLQISQVRAYYFNESENRSPVTIMADSHKELVKYLLNEKITHPVTTNFNLMGIIEFLSQEKVMPIHYWMVWKDSKIKDKTLGQIILKNTNGYYILKVGFKFDIFNVFPEPTVSNFLEIAKENKINPSLIKDIYSRNGTLMFSIYKLHPVNI